jgi:hypothetical protein
MHLATKDALLALQLFHVLFLSLHDWVPLGNLNDVRAVHAANPGRRLLATTLISVIPYAFGLVASAIYFGKPYPAWLLWWLWVSYAVLFVGELRAWWIPYLLIPEPARAARYQAMFGHTHAFLPERNGIRPNTLHVILHAATLTTLVLLGALTTAHEQP